MDRITHALIQKTPEWYAFRLDHDGASELAAVEGVSKTTTRTELLRAKSTGIAKEFSDFVQSKILDHGHDVERATIPLIEALIGEDLYPEVCSYGKLSASLDGVTMCGDIIAEVKQWSKELAASVARGDLPIEHRPQVQQQLLVKGAQKCIFAVSDGTPENFVCMDVFPDTAYQATIIPKWKQFHQDLAEFKPVEVLPPVTAAPVMALPALSIQVQGSISLVDNLAVFGEKLTAFIERLPKAPATDQEFADAEAAIKTLETAQEALEAAESSALAQVASVDEMRRTVALYAGQARSTRLMLTKLVAARKEQIRVEIVQAGRAAFEAHVAMLNKRLGKPYMPVTAVDFAGSIKGKKTVASLHDAVDGMLVRAKIEANECADRIEINLNSLRDLAGEHKFLFADTAQIITKSNDDLVNLIKLRISEHVAAENKRLEAEREKIRQEETIKADNAARAKLDREEADRREQAEAKARQEREAKDAEDKRIDAELAAEESRLQAIKAEEARVAQAEADRVAAEKLAVEAERQRGLDTDQLIAALYERIKADKRYAAIAKACAAYLAKAEKVAA